MTHITSLETVLDHLRSHSIVQDNIQPAERYGWLSVFCSFLQPSSSFLSAELSEEKHLLIQLANSPFIHEDLVHIQMLFTLFYKLTGLNCPAALGTHWDIIGFQGQDPSTDFRGVGILGLLQPLAISLSNETLPLLLNVLNLSHSPSQGFPFMVLSLNVSNIVLKALKDGHIDKMIHNKKAALEAANLCYAAILYYIYETWQKEKLSLADCGPVLKRAETICKKELCQSVDRFEKYIEESKIADNQAPVIDLDDVHCNLFKDQAVGAAT